MRQRRHRLCTLLLCAVMIITNILPTGMPVYAKAPDDADNAAAVYTSEAALQQAEDLTEETAETSEESNKEEQDDQDNTADDLDPEAKDSLENDNDSEDSFDTGFDTDSAPETDEDSNADDESDVAESDPDLDEDTETEETEEEAAQPFASGGGWQTYLTEDPQGYNLSGITMTPGSYSAEFSATSRQYISDYYFRVVYTDDEEAAEDFFSDVSSISSSALNSSVFREASFQDLHYENRHDYDDDGNYTTFYDWTGTFFGESALTPNKTYYYRLVYYSYSYDTYSYTYYFLTEPAQFTTRDPVEESQVSIRDIEEETGYTRAKVVWTVDNPEQEAIFDMRLYYAADGEENSTYRSTSAYPYQDDNYDTVPGKYYAELYNLTGNHYKAYAGVSVYTGETGTETPVTSEEIEITPKDFEKSEIALTPKEGTGSFTASIKLSPYYSVDGSIQARLYYRLKDSENDWSSSPSSYLYSTDGGSAAAGAVTISDLSENTTYEYYIELAGKTVESLGTAENPLSFTTKSIVTYEDEFFPDPVFRSYIKSQIGISDSVKITSDQLEKITYISYTRDSASGDIESLEGIQYIENLTNINFEGHAITNPGDLGKLTSLSYINLEYNDLTEFPDLSGLSVLRTAYFNYNKLEPNTITADKLPAVFLASNPNWINNVKQNQRGEVTSQLAPEYYASGEARPFLIKVTGLKGDSGRSYTLTLTVGDKSVSSKNLQHEYYDVYYIADILKDSSGADTGIVLTDGTSCTADIAMTDNYGNTYVDLTGQQLNFVAGGSDPVAETRYIRPDAKNAYINIRNLSASLVKDDIRSIELKNEKGEKVGDANPSETSIYSSYYNPYEDVFGYFYLSDMGDQQNKQLGVTVYFAKYLSSGDYTAVITMTDGTVLSAEKAVHVEDMTILTSLYASSEYDNYGDYLYLYAYGANIDPSKVWPVLYEGNEAITKVISSTVGYNRESAVYKLEKLKKDTYWNSSDDVTYRYRFEKVSGYSVQDTITDKTITLYGLYSGHDFVVFEHYNYKKGVYEVKADSTIENGTKVNVSVYSDSSHKNLKGTAEGEIKDSMLLLEFKDESGETYAPPRYEYSYFIYSYVDTNGKTQRFNHQEYVQWYNYSSSSPGTAVYVTSNMMLYQERMLTSLDIDISFGSASVSNGQKVTAQIYTSSGSAVGKSVTMDGSTGSNGYVRFTGKWEDNTGLDSGVYTIRYRLDGSDSVLYTQTLYVYDNDIFYMSNQYMGRSTSGSTSSIYVYFASEQLYGNYVNQYNSKVNDKKALEIWENGGYDLEIFDRLGNKITGWSIDHATWSGRYFYLYLNNLSEDYTGYYVKITKDGKNGIQLDTGKVYYAATSNGNEQYGVWHTLSSGFSYYTGDYAYVGFSTSNIKAYPVTVTIRRPYDTDVITSFKVSSPTGNTGTTYYFTPSDLSKTKTDEVYGLILEGADGSISTTTCYLATRNQSTVVDATGVSLNKTSLNMQLNQTEKLTATVKPDNAANKNVTWSSSKNEVATVDTDGTVTAVGVGTTTITATTHNGKTAECTVHVYNYTLSQTTISFDLSSESVETLKLTVSDGVNDISASVTWSSTDESVATVTKGTVTPTGAGTAKILAAIKNGPILACDVTVSRGKLTSIKLRDSESTLNVGDTKQMKVYLTPSDAAVSEIVWESDDPEIATVEADGDTNTAAIVTAHAAGETTIKVTVTTNSGQILQDECKVMIHAVLTEDDLVIPSGLTALTNEQFTLDDVKLPEGWSWQYPDVSLKQFAGMQSKSFAAQYTAKEEGVEPYVTSLPVALSTVTGISIGAESSSIRTDGTETLSIVWNMNGTQLDMSEYADQITWSSDKQNVASVSPDKGLTTTLTAAGAGSTTIKAEVTFKDKTYKAQYKVTVTDAEIARIQIVKIDSFTNGQTALDADTDADSDTETDTVEASTYHYSKDTLPGSGTIHVNMTVASKLTVKSSNTKAISVGKVTAAGESSYTIPVTVNAAGTAQITLTANDAAKTHKEIWLSATDATPNISEDTITVNLQQTTGMAFFLYPNAGYAVTGAELAGDAAGQFTLEKAAAEENDTYVIKAKEGTAKGTYKLTLTCNVKSLQGNMQEDEEENIETTISKDVAFTVKVVDQAPKYKVKQSTKVNLFYKDAASLLEITSDEILTGAELSGGDFTLVNRDGSYYIVPKSNDLETNCNKTGTLKLQFQGYKEVKANYTVGVEKKAPKITLVSTSTTLYPSVGLNSSIVKVKDVLDSGTTVTLDETGRDAGFTLTDQDGQWRLTGTDMTKNATVKAKLTFRNDSWRNEVTAAYTIKVNMGTPAVKLQKNSLQLNTDTAFMAYDVASTEVMWKDGALFEPIGVSASAADAKAQAIINTGIVFGFDAAENKVIARLNNTEVTKGAYKFKANVKITDTITVSAPFTVKVVDVPADKAVKVSSKGNIDVLNRKGTYVTVTPKLNSINGTITDVRLSGRAAHLFDAVCEDNKVIIHAKEGVALITKYNYKVKLVLTIRNDEGDTIQYTTPDVNLKLKQGKPKVTIAPKSTTFFSGAYNSMTQNISATLAGAENPAIANVELMNNQEAFTLDYEDGVITLRNTKDTVKGKTYSLQLRVTYEGQADNEKATTVKYSVKVK